MIIKTQDGMGEVIDYKINYMNDPTYALRYQQMKNLYPEVTVKIGGYVFTEDLSSVHPSHPTYLLVKQTRAASSGRFGSRPAEYGPAIRKNNPKYIPNYDFLSEPEPPHQIKTGTSYRTGAAQYSSNPLWSAYRNLKTARDEYARTIYNKYLGDKAEAERIAKLNSEAEAKYLADKAEAERIAKLNAEIEAKYLADLAEAERIKKQNEEIEKQYLLDLAEKERIEKENAEIDRINAENEKLLQERLEENKRIEELNKKILAGELI